MLLEINLTKNKNKSVLKTALQQGFFIVKNTMSEDLLDEAYTLLDLFFSLSIEEKLAYRVSGSNGQSGYTPPLVETAEKSGKIPDWKELFHWGTILSPGHPLKKLYPNRYPDHRMPNDIIPGIDKILVELHTQMKAFQLEVVRTISEALNLHHNYFLEMLCDGPFVNRAAWYPPMEKSPSSDHIWAVEHKDFDFITTLPKATSEGLELLHPDGEWVTVDPPEGYAVINVGMILERITNGFAKAMVHRVVAKQSEEGRLSIVQFCHPSPWTILTPLYLPNINNDEHRYPAISADTLFLETMYKINRLDEKKNDKHK